jgi:hypothetical protein
LVKNIRIWVQLQFDKQFNFEFLLPRDYVHSVQWGVWVYLEPFLPIILFVKLLLRVSAKECWRFIIVCVWHISLIISFYERWQEHLLRWLLVGIVSCLYLVIWTNLLLVLGRSQVLHRPHTHPVPFNNFLIFRRWEISVVIRISNYLVHAPILIEQLLFLLIFILTGLLFAFGNFKPLFAQTPILMSRSELLRLVVHLRFKVCELTVVLNDTKTGFWSHIVLFEKLSVCDQHIGLAHFLFHPW